MDLGIGLHPRLLWLRSQVSLVPDSGSSIFFVLDSPLEYIIDDHYGIARSVGLSDS